MKYFISLVNGYFYLFSSILFCCLTTPTLAFQLDFTGEVTGTLTNNNSDNNEATLRFGNVATDGGTALDLLITALDTYTPVNSANNGQAGSLNAGQINIARGTINRLLFQLVESGTSNPFIASSVDFDFYDVDSNGISREFVTLSTEANYEVSNPDGLNITTTDSTVTFSPQALGEVENLDDLANPSSAQEDVSVSLQFSNISSFELTFGDDNPQALPFSPGRNVFFTSQLIFSDPTTTENFQPQPVPFEFSPTSGLLISGLAFWIFKWFRQKRIPD